jgi:hypothetical protein
VTIFSRTWDTAYEALPADNESVTQGSGRIRNLKLDIQEREAVDHSWLGDANDGAHLHSTYLAQTVDPPNAADRGSVYSKTIAGNVELFYRDSAGNLIQLTSLGLLNTSPFPSGTRMSFFQSAPPVGWTQININDFLPRIVSDNTGGTTGGSWNISGTTVTTNTSTGTTTGTVTTLSGAVSVNGHALIAAEIPSHQHNFTISAAGTAFGSGSNAGYTTTGSLAGITDGGIGLTGSAHTHGVTNTMTAGSVSTSVSTSSSASSFSNDGTWRPAYYNMHVAQRN